MSTYMISSLGGSLLSSDELISANSPIEAMRRRFPTSRIIPERNLLSAGLDGRSISHVCEEVVVRDGRMLLAARKHRNFYAVVNN